MDAGLLVDKPAGLTSHDVVARVRRIASLRKVGHTGTLDPFATGLLVLCLGRATRLARFVSGLEKTYDATIRFGYATDSYDRTGKALGPDMGRSPSESALLAALARFRGRCRQTPPPFSAKKIDGRRAYDLARAGEPVTPEPVDIEVYELVLRKLEPPLAQVRLRVSSGTYVRSLAHDLGEVLGVGAHLEALRRTAVGPFGVEAASSLSELADRGSAGRLRENLIEAEALVAHLPAWTVQDSEARAAALGHPVPASGGEPKGPFRILDRRGRLVAVSEPREGGFVPLVVWTPGETYDETP